MYQTTTYRIAAPSDEPIRQEFAPTDFYRVQGGNGWPTRYGNYSSTNNPFR